MPGLINGPNFTKIPIREIPLVNGTSIGTKIREALPDIVQGVVATVTGFSLFRFLFNFKVVRIIGYMLPVIGGWLLWYRLRKEDKKPPEPSAPPHSEVDRSEDRILRFS